MDKAVASATATVFYDDPLHLEIPYTLLLERLLEPPDGLIKSMLYFALILFVYLYPILIVLISLWFCHIGAYTSPKKSSIKTYSVRNDTNPFLVTYQIL